MPKRLKQYIINNFTIKRLYYIAQYILYSSKKNVNIIKEITSEIYKTEHHNKHLYKHYFIYKILDFIINNVAYNKKLIEDPSTSLRDAILICNLAEYFTKYFTQEFINTPQKMTYENYENYLKESSSAGKFEEHFINHIIIFFFIF